MSNASHIEIVRNALERGQDPVIALAKAARPNFKTIPGLNAFHNFLTLHPEAPEWLKMVVERVAHADPHDARQMPDRFQVDFIGGIIDAIAQTPEGENVRDQYTNLDVDTHIDVLAAWLLDSPWERRNFCDRAKEAWNQDGFSPEDSEFEQDMEAGQRLEREQLFGHVVQELEKFVDGARKALQPRA